MHRLMFVAVLVILFTTVTFAVTPDSIEVTLSSGNTAWVKATQEVADSLTDVGELNAAVIVQTAVGLLRSKQVRDDKEAAEKAKQFFADADSIADEIKTKDLRDQIDKIDSPEYGAAVLRCLGVHRDYILMFSDLDSYKSLAGNALVTKSLIRRYAVEYNGPAHTSIKKVIKSTHALANEAAKTVITLSDAVKANSDNIELVRATYNDDMAKTYEALVALQNSFAYTKVKDKRNKDAEKILSRQSRHVTTDFEEISFETEADSADTETTADTN